MASFTNNNHKVKANNGETISYDYDAALKEKWKKERDSGFSRNTPAK